MLEKLVEPRPERAFVAARASEGIDARPEADVAGAFDDADAVATATPTRGARVRDARRLSLAPRRPGTPDADRDGRIDADYARAVEIAPSDVTTRYHRAHWRMNAGKFGAAIEDFDRVIAVASTRADAYADRARCRFRLDEEWYDANPDWDEDDEGDEARRARHEASLRDVERAIELGADDEELVVDHYFMAREVRGVRDARPILDDGLGRFPTSAYILRIRSSARREIEDVEGAAADHARAEAIRPSPP